MNLLSLVKKIVPSVEILSQTCYVLPTTEIGAFVYGTDSTNFDLFVTRGLLRRSVEEQEAVVAHEIGHLMKDHLQQLNDQVQCRVMQLSTSCSSGVSLKLVGELIRYFKDVIAMYSSIPREMEADEHAALCGHAAGLVSVLKAIRVERTDSKIRDVLDIRIARLTEDFLE